MRRRIYSILRVFLILMATSLLSGSPALAQLPLLGASAEKDHSPPPDALHRETPRDCFENFIKAADTGNYQKAGQYLESLPGKSPEEIKGLIDHLRVLLDRGFIGTLDAINDDPTGNLADGLAPDEEDVGNVEIKDEKLDLRLKRLSDAEGRKLWFLSQDTMRGVQAFYDKTGPETLPSGHWPAFLVQHKIWNTPLYIWLYVLLFFPLFFAISWLLVQAAILPVRWVRKWLGRPQQPYPFRSSLPYVFLLTGFLHYIAVTELGLPVLFRQYYAQALDAYIWLGIGFLIYHFAEVLMQRYQLKLIRQNRINTQSMMTLLQKLVKAAILIFIALAILRTMGFKINTALAGLGIGGLAFALAAQKTLENLFGGVSILSDQVIRVGDTCKIGNQTGVVEDISLRSTRIRTQDRTLLYVPNGSLAVQNLENFSQRDMFWFHHTLGLRYETTAKQIREILHDIQSLFEGHELVDKSSFRANFVSLGAYSLDIELFAYLKVPDNAEHLKASEELLLQCMEIVETAGAGFAFPSQTNYLAQDSLPAPKIPANQT